eukprot:gene3415-3688_t
MGLPSQYQDLYLQLSELQCGVCGKIPEQPSLCLAVGRLVCSTAGCPASREGGAHMLLAAQGGGATGLLLMRSSRFMALRRSRLTLCQSPFRDQHGEDWAAHNWGRPLRLQQEVYAMLSHLWATAGFDFDSFMLHHALLVA